jgi:hypothetical protein
MVFGGAEMTIVRSRYWHALVVLDLMCNKSFKRQCVSYEVCV